MPGGTEPIVLHRDAVSGGGYFMIGTVISADMDLIGQMQPHQQVRFEPVTMDAALAARRERAKLLTELTPPSAADPPFGTRWRDEMQTLMASQSFTRSLRDSGLAVKDRGRADRLAGDRRGGTGRVPMVRCR